MPRVTQICPILEGNGCLAFPYLNVCAPQECETIQELLYCKNNSGKSMKFAQIDANAKGN